MPCARPLMKPLENFLFYHSVVFCCSNSLWGGEGGRGCKSVMFIVTHALSFKIGSFQVGIPLKREETNFVNKVNSLLKCILHEFFLLLICRVFNVEFNGVFFLGISSFVLEILTFLNYAN